jgi:uncharacterized protein YdaU (DUF1376 family)
MAELPILPLKTDALLADTAHMSPEEFGAYCRLLFTMWRHGARLTDDAVELSRIVGVTEKRWTAISERVLRPMTTGGGILSQKRLTSTWMEVQELRAKRADAAAKRWGRGNANGHANASAGKERGSGFSNANQNQTNKMNSSTEYAAAKGPSEEGSGLKASPALAALIAGK